MEDKNEIISACVDTIEKIVIFKVCRAIRDFYKSVDSYIAAINILRKPFWQKTYDEKYQTNRFNFLFKLDENTIEDIINEYQPIDARFYSVNDVLKHINKNNIVIRLKEERYQYKSGKSCIIPDRFILNRYKLDMYLNNQDVYNLNSDFYTETQRYIIFTLLKKAKQERIEKDNSDDIQIL